MDLMMPNIFCVTNVAILPKPEDFHVDLQHVNSQSPHSLQYWTSVVDLCDETVRIYPADEGGRDVFALGNVIVKSSHLHKPKDGQQAEIDYSYADANEIEAVVIAKTVLDDVRVPEIYFAGKVCTCSPVVFLSLTPQADQPPPGSDPRTASRRWSERRMAISVAKPKGQLQTASARDS
jgi:hypothetical protein